MTPTIRAYDAKADVDEGSRTIVATINTDAVDRYRSVILPAGARLDNYRKNPVVLCGHDSCATPIGRNLWIKSQKDRLIAKTQFLPEGVDETADKVFRLYQLGFQNSWSIGFDAIEMGKPTADELRKRPDWAEAQVIFRQWELLEYSAVSVPGNADCLTQAVSRGLALPGWPEAPPAPPAPSLPPLVGRSGTQLMESIRRQIREESRGEFDRALVDAHDLARGRV